MHFFCPGRLLHLRMSPFVPPRISHQQTASSMSALSPYLTFFFFLSSPSHRGGESGAPYSLSSVSDWVEGERKDTCVERRGYTKMAVFNIFFRNPSFFLVSPVSFALTDLLSECLTLSLTLPPHSIPIPFPSPM